MNLFRLAPMAQSTFPFGQGKVFGTVTLSMNEQDKENEEKPKEFTKW